MKLAVFDFDGTITTKDSFLEFIKFCKGRRDFAIGFLIYSPIIIAYKLKIIPNWKAKQMVFRHFFKGTPVTVFDKWGQDFSAGIDKMVNPEAHGKIKAHQKAGDTVIIVSASIENWIKPWAEGMGISTVLATQLEIDSNEQITGEFLTKNCFGEEKVNRIMAAFPDRGKYFLEAYGDSNGDKEMLEFADKGWYRRFQ